MAEHFDIQVNLHIENEENYTPAEREALVRELLRDVRGLSNTFFQVKTATATLDGMPVPVHDLPPGRRAPHTRLCPDCSGDGDIYQDPENPMTCPTCAGSGRVSHEEVDP